MLRVVNPLEVSNKKIIENRERRKRRKNKGHENHAIPQNHVSTASLRS